MPNHRLVVLLAVCLGLGALAWLDNRAQTPAETADNTNRPESPAKADVRPAGADDASDNSSDHAEMDAAQYLKAQEPSISNPLGAIEISSLRDTVDRPLFASSRRRPPASASKATDGIKAPAQPPTFELLGVALGGPRAIAILRRKSDGISYRVQAGDILAGWQVSKVEPRAVVLERPEGITENIPLLRP
jgi:hypothetical protein